MFFYFKFVMGYIFLLHVIYARRLFLNGIHIPFERLYPPVQYPVSSGTPMISPYVRWEHSEDWFITKFELQRSTRSGERKVKITLTDQDYDFIAGHCIDGLYIKSVFLS